MKALLRLHWRGLWINVVGLVLVALSLSAVLRISVSISTASTCPPEGYVDNFFSLVFFYLLIYGLTATSLSLVHKLFLRTSWEHMQYAGHLPVRPGAAAQAPLLVAGAIVLIGCAAAFVIETTGIGFELIFRIPAWLFYEKTRADLVTPPASFANFVALVGPPFLGFSVYLLLMRLGWTWVTGRGISRHYPPTWARLVIYFGSLALLLGIPVLLDRWLGPDHEARRAGRYSIAAVRWLTYDLVNLSGLVSLLLGLALFAWTVVASRRLEPDAFPHQGEQQI